MQRLAITPSATLRTGICLALWLACLVVPAMAQVKPPPLPAGSAMVTVQGGMDLNETGRQTRAHHHKLHYNKDYMHDDTLDAPAQGQAAAAVQASVAMYAPQTQAVRPTPAPSQAAIPCPVMPAVPPRIPTAGDLAAMQPRPGDLAALGTASRPATAAQTPVAGCTNTAQRAANAASRPNTVSSISPAVTPNSRSTK